MKKKSEIEMEQHRIAKVTRTLIRLKHSLNADEEINAVLPETLEEFNNALQRGELKSLRPRLEEILGE